jgi:hypothetical protein
MTTGIARGIHSMTTTPIHELLVQFVRWDGNKIEGGAPQWIGEALRKGTPDTAGAIMRLGNEVHVGTANGILVARAGDWIVNLGQGVLTVLSGNEHETLFGSYDDDEALGRFGHHPDADIDFCVEVEAIDAYLADARLGVSKPGEPPRVIDAALAERIRAARTFIAKDSISSEAMDALIKIEGEVLAKLTNE